MLLSNFYLCPLCRFPAKKISNDKYHDCKRCGGIFLDKKNQLSAEKEKQRYESHNNDVLDAGYRKFVSPIVSSIIQEQIKSSHGLDFGSGPGPVISTILKENNYNIAQYDPFFADNKKLLEKKYDYIVCCEVIEHFKKPRQEFYALKNLLKPNGQIYIMTDIYKKEIDFQNWYYRNDPTHVFIYRQKTLDYILKKFNFKSLVINERLVVLKK